jgi:hypothetical protein
VLAIEEPSVRLVEVRGVPDVRRQDRVVPSDAVDLKRELDFDLRFPREAHHRGTAKALSVHDETGCPRLLDQAERHVAASILECLGEDSPAPQIQCQLPDAFGLVVPGVPAPEETHRQAGFRGEGPTRLDLFHSNSRASEAEKKRKRRGSYRHGRVLVYARLP